MLIHPQFDPVAIRIGSFSIHWYGLMYLLAFAQFLLLGRLRIKTPRYQALAWTYKDLEDLLMFLPITVRICGEEYKDKPLTGREICDARGIKTFYNSRTHRFSSSELRQRTFQSEMKKTNQLTGDCV